jgi:hypothetical protein
MFRILLLFPFSGEGRETATPLGRLENVQWMRLALSNGPNRVGVSLSSPEDGNRSSFWNVVFSSYLKFRPIDQVQKLNDSEHSWKPTALNVSMVTDTQSDISLLDFCL